MAKAPITSPVPSRASCLHHVLTSPSRPPLAWESSRPNSVTSSFCCSCTSSPCRPACVRERKGEGARERKEGLIHTDPYPPDPHALCRRWAMHAQSGRGGDPVTATNPESGRGVGSRDGSAGCASDRITAPDDKSAVAAQPQVFERERARGCDRRAVGRPDEGHRRAAGSRRTPGGRARLRPTAGPPRCLLSRTRMGRAGAREWRRPLPRLRRLAMQSGGS